MKKATGNHHGSRRGRELVIDAKKCIGCLTCQLQCSFTLTGAFNPEKAMIVIKPITHPSEEPEMTFQDDCVQCYRCVSYCPFGAITLQRRKDSAYLSQCKYEVLAKVTP